MKRAPLALVCAVSLTSPALSDPGEGPDGADCPLSPTPAQVELVRQRLALGLYNPPRWRGADVLVPMTIHVVRRSNGTGGISAAEIDNTIAAANTAWLGSGIQFCQPGATVFIDDDNFYTSTDTFAEIDALRSTAVVPDTINIYFVPNLRSELGSLCGISSFTFSTTQGIVVSNNCTPAFGNPSTFPHELGHYFDLYHTHETAFGVECTDGSNCADAGDLRCDTPADPNVGGEVPPDTCLWIGSDPPPCSGAPAYSPPVLNVMSYSAKSCRTDFTADQFAAAMATLVNLRPGLLANACDPCPNIADINDDGQLDSTDFTAWIAAFNAGDTKADQNGDGSIDPTDFTAWIANFNTGC